MTVGFRRYRTAREILEVEVVKVKQKRFVAMNRTELYGFTRKENHAPRGHAVCCQNHYRKYNNLCHTSCQLVKLQLKSNQGCLFLC